MDGYNLWENLFTNRLINAEFRLQSMTHRMEDDLNLQ